MEQVFAQSLAAGPAGPVGTAGKSSLEMDSSGLLQLLRGSLVVFCLSLVFVGSFEWRP